jgi:hypothetical protein
MKTQPKKVVSVMSQGDRFRMLGELYINFSDELREKVSFDGSRFRFIVKGAGEETHQLGQARKFLGCNITGAVKEMLVAPGYDDSHRLVRGRDYEMVLCYTGEFLNRAECTKTNVRNLMVAEFGTTVNVEPEAELVFLIRKMFSYAELKMMGLEYMAVLHACIGHDVTTNQLLSRQKGGDPWVQSWLINPDNHWDPKGAFAFPFR